MYYIWCFITDFFLCFFSKCWLLGQGVTHCRRNVLVDILHIRLNKQLIFAGHRNRCVSILWKATKCRSAQNPRPNFNCASDHMVYFCNTIRCISSYRFYCFITNRITAGFNLTHSILCRSPQKSQKPRNVTALLIFICSLKKPEEKSPPALILN